MHEFAEDQSGFIHAETLMDRTCGFLGGVDTIHARLRNSLDAHDLLLTGLPAAALVHLAEEVALLAADQTLLEKAVGVSLRTLQRRRNDADETLLSVEQSNRTWKFAEILARATEIFGTQAAAEDWLAKPAIGLGQRRPIDLLATAVGVQAVEDYLTRIDYGVYA